MLYSVELRSRFPFTESECKSITLFYYYKIIIVFYSLKIPKGWYLNFQGSELKVPRLGNIIPIAWKFSDDMATPFQQKAESAKAQNLFRM